MTHTEFSRKGGRQKSEAKQAAAEINLAKAREAKALKKNGKRTNKARRAAYTAKGKPAFGKRV